jgi:hypothetical protein
MPDPLKGTRTMDLVKWVMSLTDDETRGYLLYLCGWKPEIIVTIRAEAVEAAYPWAVRDGV